ncbi:MAG: sulfatase, partial [Planctomycetes bacterium]|nr:sulfatase [Planctomycetota bacterium]
MTQDSRRDGSRAPGDDRPNWGRRILISLAYGIPFLTLLLIAHQGRQLEGCGGSGESGTRHVILVLMDTVRADRLQCLGYSKETTPFLTGAGERLRAFRNAYTTSPWTLPACAALLTGLEPSQHGAGDLGDLANLRTHVPTALREDVPTLASHLLLHGVRTEAYFTNPFLNFGLQRGFETCIDLPDATAVDVVTRFESSLRTWNPDESHFAYLHFMDAHEPLRPDVEDLRALDATSPLPNLPMSWYGMLAMPDELRRRHDWNWSYEASLRRIDRALEHLFTLLDETGRRDDTLVIITADHGEALWDHPREERFWYDQGVLSGTGHGQSFFPELMRIPLLVSWPLHPLEADKLVSLLDIAPTVLDALDLPLPSEVRWNGFSLARWRREDRRLVFEGLSRGRHKRATLDGDGTMFIEAGDTLEPELLARSTFHLEDRIAEDQPARTERRQFLEQASKP